MSRGSVEDIQCVCYLPSTLSLQDIPLCIQVLCTGQYYYWHSTPPLCIATHPYHSQLYHAINTVLRNTWFSPYPPVVWPINIHD